MKDLVAAVPNYRHAQIAGGFQLIAGHIAQTSRVDRESLAQHEFHD
jgi:hypothetical protein